MTHQEYTIFLFDLHSQVEFSFDSLNPIYEIESYSRKSPVKHDVKSYRDSTTRTDHTELIYSRYTLSVSLFLYFYARIQFIYIEISKAQL